MERRYWRQISFGISLVLAIYLCMPTFLVLAQDPKSGQYKSEADFPVPAAVDSQVAGMTDEQVRQAYAQNLSRLLLDALKKRIYGVVLRNYSEFTRFILNWLIY